MNAYRKVPCKHEREMRGGGIGGVGRRETCIDGSSVLWSCDGTTYEPWPEVEAVVEAANNARSAWYENMASDDDFRGAMTELLAALNTLKGSE